MNSFPSCWHNMNSFNVFKWSYFPWWISKTKAILSHNYTYTLYTIYTAQVLYTYSEQAWVRRMYMHYTSRSMFCGYENNIKMFVLYTVYVQVQFKFNPSTYFRSFKTFKSLKGRRIWNESIRLTFLIRKKCGN